MRAPWRHAAPVVAGAMLLLGGAASALGAQRATLERVLRDTVLDNGLTVIALRNPAVPVATVMVAIRSGAFTQLDADDEGVPHLLEHMLFKSFGNGRETFAERASRLYAEYNGTTSDELVTYWVMLPSRNAAGGIELMGDLMRSPTFRRDDLAPEQRVVRGELERNVADPMFLLNVAVNRLLWGTAFGRKHAIGTVPSIESADAARLRRHYERYYVPNNAALVVAGDVEHADVFAQAARHFGSWKRGADPFAEQPIPPVPALERDTIVAVVEGDGADVTIMLRWQGPSVDEDPAATHAADVFSALVNQPHSGLQRRLVESGLFRSVSVSYYTLAHVGPITITARAAPEKIVPAMQALRSEIARFDDPDYFTAEELTIAKKRVEVDAALELESGSSLAYTIGFWWGIAGLDYYRGYVDGMLAQEPADLRAYVSRYVVGRPKVMGLLFSEATRVQHGRLIAQGVTQWFW